MRGVNHLRTGTVLAAVAIVALTLVGCGDGPAPESAAVLQLSVVPAIPEQDVRTYSVGTVQMRALDSQLNVLAVERFAVDRATGIFDLVFDVPAGLDRQIVVEPLGSSLLPDGGKTESGVALFGRVVGVDIEAGTLIEREIDLRPFIPNNPEVVRTVNPVREILVWQPMQDALSHEIRVIEELVEEGTREERLLEVVSTNQVPLDAIAREGYRFVGFQVRSVNPIATSAFTDTVFVSDTTTP